MTAQGMGGDIIYIVQQELGRSPGRTTWPTARPRPTRRTRSGCWPPSSAALGIRVNGINPDGVVRGSGIFAGGWGAQRAAVYGVPEDELGAFYAQRTLLKREVLPEHIAAAVVALTAGDLSPDHRPAHPGGRGRGRRVPALRPELAWAARLACGDVAGGGGRPASAAGSGGPGRARRLGGARYLGSPTCRCGGPDRFWDMREVHRFPNGRSSGWARCTGTSCGLYRGCAHGPGAAAAATFADLASVGIDSWGVDYGLLDAAGALLGNPVHYRDARTERSRTACWPVPAADLYAVTGIQQLPINTIYQLAAAAGQPAAGRGPDPAADPRPARLLADRAGRRRGDQRVHDPAARRPGPDWAWPS